MVMREVYTNVSDNINRVAVGYGNGEGVDGGRPQ